MKNTQEKSRLRKATRENLGQLNGGPISDTECEEIENNMKGFMRCLIDMDNNLKERMLEDGDVKCTICNCPITKRSEFHFTSSKPMCKSCYEKEYEKEVNEFKKL